MVHGVGLGRAEHVKPAEPLRSKTGHSGWSRPSTHNKTLQNTPAADYADFRVVDFHLVNNRADVGAAEGRVARQNIIPRHFHGRSDHVRRNAGAWARFGERTM
jgi:hypothetical protein